MNRYVVKIHRPGQWSIAVIGLSAMIAITTWFLLDKGHWSIINRVLFENTQLSRLIEKNSALEKENQDLLEKNVMVEKLTAMDKQTASLLQDEIASLQEEIFRMKQELEFYHGVMAGTGDTSGLSIQGLHIYPLSRPNTFLINLVLTHVAKSVMVAEGELDITFLGHQNDNELSLNLRQLLKDKSVDLTYKFRNFKKYDLEVSFPEDFVPTELSVLLKSKDKRQTDVGNVFSWAVEN